MRLDSPLRGLYMLIHWGKKWRKRISLEDGVASAGRVHRNITERVPEKIGIMIIEKT